MNSDPEKVRQLVLPLGLAGTALAGWLAGWLALPTRRARLLVLGPSAAHDAPKNRAKNRAARAETERAREQGGTFGLSLPLFCKS